MTKLEPRAQGDAVQTWCLASMLPTRQHPSLLSCNWRSCIGKTKFLGHLGAVFQIYCNAGASLARMLKISNNFWYYCSNHLCSSCQKRKWKCFPPSLSYWKEHGFGNSKPINFTVPLSFALSHSGLHSALLLLSLHLLYNNFPSTVPFWFSMQNRIKGKSIKLTNMLLILVITVSVGDDNWSHPWLNTYCIQVLIVALHCGCGTRAVFKGNNIPVFMNILGQLAFLTWSHSDNQPVIWKVVSAG